MPKTPITNLVDVNPALLAFRPRQVSLLSKPPSMKQDDSNNGQKTLTLKVDQKAMLLRAIAQYLERSDFSKTLKKLLKEAKIEKDDLRDSLFDLEEMFCKFLEICGHTSKKFENNKVQDLHADGMSDDGEGDFAARVGSVSDRKKKRSDKSDSHAIGKKLEAVDKSTDSKNVEGVITHDSVAMDVKDKEKKRNKKNSDSLGQKEEFSAEVLKQSVDSVVLGEPDKKSKDKKKKKYKLDSKAVGDESLHRTTGKKSEDGLFSEGITDSETQKKSKDKMKRKNVLSSDDVADNVGQCVSECKQVAPAKKLKEVESMKDSEVANFVVVDASEVLLENKGNNSKGKKKHVTAVPENFCGRDTEELEKRKSNDNDFKKDDFETANKDMTHEQNKESRKRKRLSSEKETTQSTDGKAVEESKYRKMEGSEELKGSRESGKLKTVEKAWKEESNQLRGQANGNLEDNGEKSPSQKSSKKQKKGSVETQTVEHFQRIKVDDMVFSDERLKDNSYWAKDGAENGYGAKAQEILGQVRGRDFRHEKTKKKRGSYRGGQIDQQSHSVKFSYSDDD